MIPTFPLLWISGGMIPILHSSGLIMPGQFGPISRDLFWVFKAFFIYIMSCKGIPSVMAIIKGISASIASIIACLHVGAGTNIMLASQLVSFLASKQFLNTGTPRCFVLKFLGFTPRLFKFRISEKLEHGKCLVFP